MGMLDEKCISKKLIWIEALVVASALGCATGTEKIAARAAPKAAELTDRGGPAAGRVSQRHLENFQLCADRNPGSLTGRARLEIEVGIEPDGRVLQARAASVPPRAQGLADCVTRALTWIEFERDPGTYRRYRLGLAAGRGGRIRVDLTDLDAPKQAQAGPGVPALTGMPAELAGAIEGVKDRD